MSTFRILVIDDNLPDCEFIEGIAQSMGCQTRSMTTLTGVDEILEQFKPDMLFVDFMMGRETGLDFIMRITRKGEDCHLPIVFMTAYSSKELLEDALALGASDCLNKSDMNKTILAELIDHHLHKASASTPQSA